MGGRATSEDHLNNVTREVPTLTHLFLAKSAGLLSAVSETSLCPLRLTSRR